MTERHKINLSNFPIERKPIYEKAIMVSGDKHLCIGGPFGGFRGLMGLYDTFPGVRDLSFFWRIFDMIKEEEKEKPEIMPQKHLLIDYLNAALARAERVNKDRPAPFRFGQFQASIELAVGYLEGIVPDAMIITTTERITKEE